MRLRQRLQWAAHRAIGVAGFKGTTSIPENEPCAPDIGRTAFDASSPAQQGKILDSATEISSGPPNEANRHDVQSLIEAWGAAQLPQASLPQSSPPPLLAKLGDVDEKPLENNMAIPAESVSEISHLRKLKNSLIEGDSTSGSLIFSSKALIAKPILVLDLDETLIHSSLMPRRASDFWIEVIQNNDIRTREVFWVYKRPGVDKFLAEICEYYTIYIFTAGIREYASQILDRLDPTNTMIKGRFYRDECTEIKGQGTYAKDLTKIPGDLSRVILVDNTPACYSLQPANGLPIRSWYTDICDRQLLRLQEFLIDIATLPDLRQVLPEWNM